MTGIIWVIEVSPTTLTINQECIRLTVFRDQTTVAPVAKEPPKDNRTETDETDAEREKTHARDMLLEEENVTNAPPEYAVGHILRHVG